MEERKIIEINGVKIDMDLRTATNIDTFKVGDRVKVLKKEYGDNYKTLSGVIVDFINFKKLPTIVVAAIQNPSYDPELKIFNINAKSEDLEIASDHTDVPMSLDKERILESLDKKIEKKRFEIEEIQLQRKYFIEKFGICFGDVT